MLIDTYSRKTGKSEQMDDSLLEKKEGRDGRANWVEYWFQGECVHRSSSVQAMGVNAEGVAADLPAGKAIH